MNDNERCNCQNNDDFLSVFVKKKKVSYVLIGYYPEKLNFEGI